MVAPAIWRHVVADAAAHDPDDGDYVYEFQCGAFAYVDVNFAFTSVSGSPTSYTIDAKIQRLDNRAELGATKNWTDIDGAAITQASSVANRQTISLTKAAGDYMDEIRIVITFTPSGGTDPELTFYCDIQAGN